MAAGVAHVTTGVVRLFTVRVKVRLAIKAGVALSVAVIVIGKGPKSTVGVPVIAPVPALSVRPAGSAFGPVTEKTTAPVPPAAVTGVNEAAATFRVRVWLGMTKVVSKELKLCCIQFTRTEPLPGWSAFNVTTPELVGVTVKVPETPPTGKSIVAVPATTLSVIVP